jgi:hypothetical protein
MIAPDYALQHCITWNTAERNKAQRDASNADVVVPRHAVKRIAGKLVPLSKVEYRDVRHGDADRFERNIKTLSGYLA